MLSENRIERGFNFLLLSRAVRSGALSFSAIAYPLYLKILGFSNLYVGFLTGFVVVFTVIQTMILGVLGDRIGYKYSMIIGEIFPLISTAVLFFVTSGPLIYLSVIGGIAGGPGGMRGAFSPGSTALVAKNWKEPNDRVKKLGLMTTVGSIFAVVGGVMVISRSDVSSFVGNAGSYRTLFGISFLLVLISFISLFLVAERKSEKKKTGFVGKGSVRHIGKTVFANAFNGAGIGISMPILSLWFSEMYPSSTTTTIGIVFTISYISTAIGSYISSIYRKRGEKAAKIGSYGRMLQGLLMIPLALSPYFYIAGIFYIFRAGIAGFGLPSRSNINVSGLKEGDYGAGTGLQASAARIAQTTSGASGALMDVYLPLPEIAGGIIQFLAGVAYYDLFARKKKPEVDEIIQRPSDK
ncbi:MFS transporter [Cuniculiplasma divulgatum]|uniref:UMF12 family major facilitator superfamily permease n=1 Tax=Cuniculiplasma divulgatum TaxID=1673428 RepID=A0A1R4A9E6_9ARCH|nr:MFS transporter [Cuniculiplasma divulgatum]WMT49989.1 MAG: MFS transporter [Thermoplasmatales archaeon]SJK85582.1 UMF12 family major facilitator superfamily permease [Cuniculiplasma divulgatum]